MKKKIVLIATGEKKAEAIRNTWASYLEEANK